MKKILTAVAVCAISAIGALGFTACGGNDEVRYTVTEEEWNTAFDVLDFKADISRPDFSCGIAYAAEGRTETATGIFDFSGEKFYLSMENAYFWKDSDGVTYGSDGETFKIVSDESVEVILNSNLDMFFTDIMQSVGFDVECKFTDFTFDADKNVYVQTKDGNTISVKFENAYIVAINAESVTEGVKTTAECTIKYNQHVTISDKILDMEITKD